MRATISPGCARRGSKSSAAAELVLGAAVMAAGQGIRGKVTKT